MVKLNLKSEFKNVQENEKSCKKTIDWKRDNELEEILFINYLNHKSLKIDKFDWMKNSIFPLSLSLFDTIGLCSIISQS